MASDLRAQAIMFPPRRPWAPILLLAGILVACGSDLEPHESGDLAALHPPRTDSGSDCSGRCDAAAPSIPILSDTLSHGDVTTYGGVGNTNPSAGGACNYGVTGITHYAAIQVSQLPGDLRGQWNGGRVCGQCFEVRARTPDGWRSTHVRIVDKCPDGFCGIDLGGAPATDLMGIQAGRYSGQWRPVSCKGLPGVSDGPAALHVKEGSNRWWSLVQVRNPPGAVREIRLRQDLPDAPWTSLPWATEAENFFKVPQSILQDSVPYLLKIVFEWDSALEASTTPTALSTEGNRIPLR